MTEQSQTSQTNSRGAALANYIAAAPGRAFPPEVVHEARRALVDYLGVTIVAAFDETVVPVRKTVARWHATGKARIVLGGTTSPAVRAGPRRLRWRRNLARPTLSPSTPSSPVSR